MEPSLTSLTLIQHRKLRHGGAKELIPGPRPRTVHRPAGSRSVLRRNDFRANRLNAEDEVFLQCSSTKQVINSQEEEEKMFL